MAATIESSIDVFQKTENRAAMLPSNSTSGNLPEENKITNPKRQIHSYVYHSINYNSQNIETA